MIKSLSFMFILLMFSVGFAKGDPLKAKEVQLRSLSEKKLQRKSPAVKASFAPFTGKVKGDKVRVRLQPDLEGHIIRELEKNAFVSVIDQEGDFWCITSPEKLKVYIFRSFVLDNVVEGNRVNVRLEPDLDAPIIGHLNAGDHVIGKISKHNKKWLEISPPQSTRFYISKSYVDFVGGPKLREEIKNRKKTVVSLLEIAQSFSAEEMQQHFEKIDFDQIKAKYITIIQKYSDFPNHIEKASEFLTKLENDYLQKRIAYLEAAAEGSYQEKKTAKKQPQRANIAYHLRNWKSVENGLYLSWTELNEGKDKSDYYEEQRLAAVSISGILEAYVSPVKNKPGDFIMRSKGRQPVAHYVYSTKIDLANSVGKKVTLLCSPRPNHNFAFPAYFVHDVE